MTLPNSKIINVGDTANDKKGDSLRAAFQKVNANFDELYTALGLADTSLNLGAFEFNGSVMTTTDSSAIIIDQVTTVASDLTVGGDILPQTANGGNLGSLTKPWKSLYVSTSTIYIGGVPLSLDNSNNLLVNNAPISTTIEYTNIPNAPTDVADLTDAQGLLDSAATILRTDITNGASAVIYTANSSYTGYKLVIIVEGRLDGDGTSTQHTQTCEATIAAIYNSNAEPVISVYGVIYTSPSPLATFTVRRGINNEIEVVATNSQTTETLHASVHAVKFVSYYD